MKSEIVNKGGYVQVENPREPKSIKGKWGTKSVVEPSKVSGNPIPFTEKWFWKK